MYCPKCRYQFRDGFNFCEQCNESLVETLPLEPVDKPVQLEKHLDADESLICIGNKTAGGIIAGILGVLVFGFLSVLMSYLLYNDLQIQLWVVLLTIFTGVLLIYFIFNTILAFLSFYHDNYHDKIYLTDKNVIFVKNQEFSKVSLNRILMIAADNVRGEWGVIRYWYVRVKLINGREYQTNYITKEAAIRFEREFRKWVNQKR
jgi:hypothetical protein